VKFDPPTTKELLATIANTLIEHRDELTELDRAIGDADHGVNLDRGFKAVLANVDRISALSFGAALKEVGRTLIMAVGGASGPLYGKLFATVGLHLENDDDLSKDRVVVACDEAIKVVKALGRSDVGQKTMLDVLVPALDALRAGSGRGVLLAVRERADRAAEETVPMLALRGRASFLAERSRGHMDPGARSSSLIVGAVCTFLESRVATGSPALEPIRTISEQSQ
jgi:dihydroxyacetone kinase-like protein